MNWRNLPPLSAMRAYAAFAEQGDIVSAGAALNVSHAAISQQLRALEKHLDVALLDRTGRALQLTKDGQELAEVLQTTFGQMISAAEAITGAQDLRPLHISTTPTFAASWLMPRLSNFRADHPDVDVVIDPSPKLVDLAPDGADLAIRYGAGPWPGVQAEMLLSSPMVVAAAPKLVGRVPVSCLTSLADYPWLEEFGTTESSNWLGKFGGVARSRRGVLQVPGNLLLDGARDGQGIAVIVRAFIERDLAAGRLVELYRDDSREAGYHLVTRAGVMRPVLKSFVSWIRKEARAGAIMS